MADESKIKISAVLFDYGMVLSSIPEELHWRALERVLGAEEKAFQAAYWKYRDAYDRGALSAQTYWETVARDLDKPIDASVLHALIDADTNVWTQPNVEMMEWAARLNRAGIKTGILSNIGDAMELGVLGRFPALAEFTHHTFSHRLGIAKPDAGIYRHAVEGLGVPAGEILFVDDREENIVAARAAGMVAVQYLGHGGFVAEMGRLGLGSLLRL
ncbi:MAG: HAD family phosphatase [Acidobacteriaceae bacterium]|jgi:putative hydrolase of the HAD superfamily